MIGDFTGHDMAQAREDGYDRGVQLATKYERILIDLIAELRHRHTPYRVCMECDDWYAGCEAWQART